MLHDRGASLQILSPHWSLQFPSIHTPGSELQISPVSHSTDLEPGNMSSFTNLFKKARSKTEREQDQQQSAISSQSSAGSPVSPTSPAHSQPRTPVIISALPAHWGPLYQAGEDNPHSPLRQVSAQAFLNAPYGPPHIDEADIGTKFPTLSNGPGIERRVWIDPTFRRVEPLGSSAHSVSRENTSRYRSNTSPTPYARVRSTPLELLHSAIHHPIGTPDNQVTPNSNHLRSPQSRFPNPSSEENVRPVDDSTVGSILQKYAAAEDDDLNKEVEGNHGPHINRGVEIDPRLSQWDWSPAGSMYDPSACAENSAESPSTHRYHSMQIPTAPPTVPLPRLPLVIHEGRNQRYDDTTNMTGQSSSGYENTHNLLGLSSRAPGSSDEIIQRVSLESTSDAESMFQRLITPQTRQIERSSSSRSYAQVSIVGSDGSVHSRQLSAQETTLFEEEVFSRLRGSGMFGASHDRYVHRGHLSLEYLNDDDDAGELGPGGSQSSSSLSAAHPRIIRSGTPPLLYGTRAIGRGQQTRSQPNAQTQIGRAIGGEEDDQDWETVAESYGPSRRFLRDIEVSAGTGSSLADFSDSSNPSAVRSVSRGQGFLHPAHPRYQNSWTMLQDAQNGSLVLTPEYSGIGVSANLNAVAPLRAKYDTSSYHHPRPLSEQHDNPFNSAPTLIRPSDGALYIEERFPPSIPTRSPSKQVVSSTSAKNISGRNLDQVDDGEWLSTVDGATSTNEDKDISVRKGSFAQVAIVGARANITGTPGGTGAREVGSSLADASSPPNEIDTPENMIRSVHHRRTIDGSLDSATANAPGNFSERIANHHIFHQDSDSDSLKHAFETTPPEELSPEIRQHRQHLVDRSLLPRLPTPPFTEPKRFSVPDHLLKSASSSNMVKNEPHTTAGSLVQQDGSHVRMRSPLRRDAEGDISANIPTPFSNPATEAESHVRMRLAHKRDESDDIRANIPTQFEALTGIPPRQRKKRAQWTKQRAKDKGSDEESSPEAKTPGMAPGKPWIVAEGEASVSTLDLNDPGKQYQDQPEPRVNNLHDAEPRKAPTEPPRARVRPQSAYIEDNIEEPEIQTPSTGPTIGLDDDVIFLTPTRPRRPGTRRRTASAGLNTAHTGPSTAHPRPSTANARPNTARAGAGTHNQEQHGWVGPYDDFIRATRGDLNNDRGRPERPIPAGRPIARAESPHLHRLPRPTGPGIRTREKELSRVFLALCSTFPPILLLYGYGLIDGVMVYSSRGAIMGFRNQEKMVALILGYALCFGLPTALFIGYFLVWK